MSGICHCSSGQHAGHIRIPGASGLMTPAWVVILNGSYPVEQNDFSSSTGSTYTLYRMKTAPTSADLAFLGISQPTQHPPIVLVFQLPGPCFTPSLPLPNPHSLWEIYSTIEQGAHRPPSLRQLGTDKTPRQVSQTGENGDSCQPYTSLNGFSNHLSPSQQLIPLFL